jgi:hypothetical protein
MRLCCMSSLAAGLVFQQLRTHADRDALHFAGANNKRDTLAFPGPSSFTMRSSITRTARESSCKVLSPILHSFTVLPAQAEPTCTLYTLTPPQRLHSAITIMIIPKPDVRSQYLSHIRFVFR